MHSHETSVIATREMISEFEADSENQKWMHTNLSSLVEALQETIFWTKSKKIKPDGRDKQILVG